LYDVITRALEKSRFIGIILSDNFDDSRYATEEMKQALARERRGDRVILLPLLFGCVDVPAFLDDKLYLDFRSDYHVALTRLAGLIHQIPRQHIEESIRDITPKSIRAVIEALRYSGKEPYVVLPREDRNAILRSGAQPYGDGKLRFSPEAVARNGAVSPRLRKMMNRLLTEIW
jgi:hypothetical protein